MSRFLLILTFCIVLVSCEDDDCQCYSTDIIGSWMVTELISIESVSYSKKDNFNPVIEFKADGTIDAQLDINSCFGEYTVSESSINIEGMGCTEACCDSEYSVKVVDMLTQVTNYSLEGDYLKLNVPEWGWLKLVPLNQVD